MSPAIPAKQCHHATVVIGSYSVLRAPLPPAGQGPELAGPCPTPLERLAVARVVACWLQTAYFDAQQAQARALGPTQARVLVQLHESANHRYLAAIKTLAMLRKLLPARPARPTVPDAARFTGGHNDAETLVKGVALLN